MDHSFDDKYLPPEIWRHILANLRVKTLLRFRCVCKSWCSIIDHPDFVYALKRHKINSNTSKIFALQALNLRCHGIRGCVLTDRHDDTLQKTAHIFQSSNRYHILGRCDELLLMGCYVNVGNLDDFYYREEMSLWNPSIRKSFLMPTCPLPCATLLFGFAPRSKDYKVVALSYGKLQIMPHTKMYVAVFTLSNQQWTNNGLEISGSYIYSMFGSYRIPSHAFYCQGAAHWIVGKPGSQSAHLVTFNFDSENFTIMEIPADSVEPGTERFLFLLEESLALFSISSVSLRIWILEQEKGNGVWTNWISRCSNCDDYDLFFNRWPYSIVLYRERDDGKFFLFGDKLYNISYGGVRKLEKIESSSLEWGVYTESLVLWKGYEAEKMASLPYNSEYNNTTICYR
ncbi:F-box/kelch-repeat protein At3g23880-like [Silene latifolia]|uniref:F-box/kelch-repeat protein At3g23880-like n=1 Tax=Silene latifolia TaxID=37657 RepID=UPI003D77C7CB